MYILGTSPSTQRTKNRHFQPQKSADKERRQNILTKLVTKFSTSLPLTTPTARIFPPPREQTKISNCRDLVKNTTKTKIHSGRIFYHISFNHCKKQKSIPTIVNIFDTNESLFDFDY